jgi:hypothetical protein
MQVIPHPGQAGNDRQVIQQPWRGEHIKIVSRQKHLHPKEVEIRQRNCCFLHKIDAPKFYFGDTVVYRGWHIYLQYAIFSLFILMTQYIHLK